MGIPSGFRWLSQKYPKIISPVIEELPHEINGIKVPVDATGPNPNHEEFDNLYLDMNGIVHPCSHPEDRPPPENEEEMMLEIFKYTQRIFNMVRPRKLLMIAIDGVAPRAKMNQQRSRRFRSAREAREKEADQAELLKMMKSQSHGQVSESTAAAMNKKVWDHNAITPGTPFMDILSASLKYWTAYKLNTDPAWAKVKVILSDATVPGEGEHKIMQFIRSQRASPEHDPNTRHVIYGLDADLIMLGLATHEPHFRVLREDVFFQQAGQRTCRICGQKGHEARECTGNASAAESESSEILKEQPLKPFIWLHVSILREYLEVEMFVPNQPFRFDLERALDDWVFMCFFVGNDFLPHLPSLEIRENGIDTLIAIWRDNIPYMGGYVTKDGHVDLERAQFILQGLAKQEDAIFRRRKQTEERREAGAKRRKLQDEANQNRSATAREYSVTHEGRRAENVAKSAPANIPLFNPGNMASNINREARQAKDLTMVTHDMIVNGGGKKNVDLANKSAAAALKSQLLTAKTSVERTTSQTPIDTDKPVHSNPGDLVNTATSDSRKRKADLPDSGNIDSSGSIHTVEATATSANEEPVDTVRLWEDGYADRYYEQKFKVDPQDIKFRQHVGQAYVTGLAWVLLYYFQGCPSWEWYYPYHYAPFAADFVGLADMKISFQKGRIFKPFEQLMGVMPAASKSTIPEAFHTLMTDEESDIIDFYPEDFTIDLNGKKFAWQGVALLPFIDADRLLQAMERRYPLLPPEEALRNAVGREILLVAEEHKSLYNYIATHFYTKKQNEHKLRLNQKISEGLAGEVEKSEDYLPHSSLIYPLDSDSLPSLDEDRSISVYYEMPQSKHMHKSMLLRGVKFSKPALNQTDIEATKTRATHTGRGHGGAPFRGESSGRSRGRGRFNYSSGSNNHLSLPVNHDPRSQFNGQWHPLSQSHPPPQGGSTALQLGEPPHFPDLHSAFTSQVHYNRSSETRPYTAYSHQSTQPHSTSLAPSRGAYDNNRTSYHSHHSSSSYNH